MSLFRKKKVSGQTAFRQVNETPETLELDKEPFEKEKIKSGFSLFKKKNREPKKVKEKKNGFFKKKEVKNPEDENAYVEKMVNVPYIQCIPDAWCRSYLIDRVAGQIKRQISGILSVFVCIMAVVLVITGGTLLLSGYTDKRITSYLKDTNLVLENYSDEIKNAISLGGVLTFTHDVPIHEQYKGIVKNLAESAVIAHEVRFNHNLSEIPNNVKNNFEAQTALKFENVQITGIWFVDCSYLKAGAEQGGEQWILDVNRRFQALYRPYAVNVYVDMATRNYSSARDDMTRGELVIVFWK